MNDNTRCLVFTGRYRIQDPDRLDITRAGCDRARKAGNPAPGEFLAPSTGLVFPTLEAMKAAKTKADRDRVWSGYVASYRYQMIASYKFRRDEWTALLARPRVVLVCFCADPSRCHRTLAASYLVACGAERGGEIGLKKYAA